MLNGFWKDKRHDVASTPSTNTLAKEASLAGPSWELFVTDHQTAGYGQKGRSWDSPPGNLAFTLLARQFFKDQVPKPQVSLVAGVGVAKVLQKYLPVGVTLKWPNDIYVLGKKMGGILIQTAHETSLVVGIGLNVNSLRTDFPEAERENRTTLREILGHEVSKEEILSEVVKSVKEELLRFQSGEWPDLLKEYQTFSYFQKGMPLQIEEGPSGFFEKIQEDGRLVLVDFLGKTHVAGSGRIILSNFIENDSIT